MLVSNVADPSLPYSRTNTTVAVWVCNDIFNGNCAPTVMGQNCVPTATRPWCYTTDPAKRFEYCDIDGLNPDVQGLVSLLDPEKYTEKVQKNK